VIKFFKDGLLSITSLARSDKNKNFIDFLKYNKFMLAVLG